MKKYRVEKAAQVYRDEREQIRRDLTTAEGNYRAAEMAVQNTNQAEEPQLFEYLQTRLKRAWQELKDAQDKERNALLGNRPHLFKVKVLNIYPI